jgi:hypothetical protein
MRRTTAPPSDRFMFASLRLALGALVREYKLERRRPAA